MYLQSFLLGTRTVVVGFRTRTGQISALQRFSTLEIPRLVRGKPHAWDHAAAVGGAHALATFIRDSIAASPPQVAADDRFRAVADAADATSSPWPVFRVRFDGATRRVEVRELDESEREPMLSGADRAQRDRVGFLLREWVNAAFARRRRVDPSYQLAPRPIRVRRAVRSSSSLSTTSVQSTTSSNGNKR
jgi:RAT1-interacting protein